MTLREKQQLPTLESQRVYLRRVSEAIAETHPSKSSLSGAPMIYDCGRSHFVLPVVFSLNTSSPIFWLSLMFEYFASR